jgi:hypothetical protein
MANEETINVPGPVTYLILIGISEYKDPAWNIPTCKNDCHCFRDLLKTKYQGIEVYKELYNEEATLKNIDLAIADFNKNTEINKEPNNLIIFYSGHGGIYDTTKRKIGGWLPWDYKDDPRTELLLFDNLAKLTEPMNTTHVLIISDSCYSGGIANHGNLFDPISVALDREDIGLEPSRWCLASSRADKESLSGKGASNSLFTATLLAILEAEISESLSFTTIQERLEKAFGDHDVQRVVYRRLNTHQYNDGVLKLHGKETAIETYHKTAFLESGLLNLNYKTQRGEFSKFNGAEKKQFAFFSGTPDCGLPLLAMQAKKHRLFPADHLVLLAAPAIINGEGETKILNLFNSFPSYKNFRTLNFLAGGLLKTLKEKHIVLELYFYKDVSNTEISYRDDDKKEFLDDLAAFVATINNMEEKDKKLFVFVIDQENCDYKKLFPGAAVNGIAGIALPPVEPIQYQPTEDWFEQLRNVCYLVNAEKGKLFDNYFPANFLEHIKTMIANNQSSPAIVVKGMCDKSGCGHLADKLLNPKLK